LANRILVAFLLLLLLAGCAVRQGRIASCTVKTDPAINRELAEAACSGNKLSQFMLGYLLETGEGVAADPKKAVKWYQRAARPTRGMSHADVAPVGKQAYGRVIPVQTGPETPGIPAAEYRLGLMYLEGRGVQESRNKAMRWLRSAAEKGHDPAAAALEELEAETQEIGG
jgi:TPR repeat protein